MKAIKIYASIILSLIFVSFLTSGCSDEYEYNPNYSGYNGVTLKIDLVDQDNVLNLNLINGTYSVKVNVTPENIIINPKGYIYEIADETIATINNEGLITMLKEGETELTVKFRGNQDVSTKCTLRIKPILTEKLTVPEEITVQEEKTFDLLKQIATVPSEASKKFSYQVADETVATINEEGIVTGISEGNTTITVTTTDGTNLSGEVKVKVVGKIYISEIQFPDEKVNGKSFVVGQVLNLAKFIKILPGNASEPVLKYTVTSGENVVSVSEDGIVTCLSAGDATITVEANDNNPTPIPAKEIKIKVVASGWYERSFWTVDTSYRFEYDGKIYNYVADKSNGAPELLLDNKNDTYFVLIRPDKDSYKDSASGITFPGKQKGEQFFVVDMGGELEFNKVFYRHRSEKNCLVKTISILGSNDGENFTPILENHNLDIKNTDNNISVKSSKYRWVKVVFVKWDTANTNMVVSEFNVCKE